MTPREKAEELLSIFAKIIPASSYEAYEEGVKINFDLENARQCALAAVDEILEVIHTNVENAYYQKVKQEIEEL